MVYSVSGALSCSWVPDIHTFLPCVSGNFLPLCHYKCLQRHRPMFKVADMCCRGGRSHLPSGDVLKIGILLYTCWYLFSFPTLGAAPGMLCKDGFLAKCLYSSFCCCCFFVVVLILPAYTWMTDHVVSLPSKVSGGKMAISGI